MRKRNADYEIAGAGKDWCRVVVVSPPGILEEATFDHVPDGEFYIFDPQKHQLVSVSIDDAFCHLGGGRPAILKPDIGTFASVESCLAFIREMHDALASV